MLKCFLFMLKLALLMANFFPFLNYELSLKACNHFIKKFSSVQASFAQ